MGHVLANAAEPCCTLRAEAWQENLAELVAAGSAIQTAYRTIRLPSGVAVERLRTGNYRSHLRTLPSAVQEILVRRGAQANYARFAQALASISSPMNHVDAVVDVLIDMDASFRETGVSVHLCAEEEITGTGEMEKSFDAQPVIRAPGRRITRWLTYVDRIEHPGYVIAEEAKRHVTREYILQDHPHMVLAPL